MKVSVSTNKYPDNYVEEPLPHVLVEVRFKNDDKFNRRKAILLADDIEKFVKRRIAAYCGSITE